MNTTPTTTLTEQQTEDLQLLVHAMARQGAGAGAQYTLPQAVALDYARLVREAEYQRLLPALKAALALLSALDYTDFGTLQLRRELVEDVGPVSDEILSLLQRTEIAAYLARVTAGNTPAEGQK